MIRVPRLLVASLALVALAVAPARAQPDARPDLSGTWVLDRDISVDLAQINLIPSPGAFRPQGRTRSAGFGGFGGGGFGGGRTRSPNKVEALTTEEQARLKTFAEALKTGWSQLVISLHDPTFVVNDAHDRTLFFQTDGSASDNHVGDATLSSSTRWDGAHLVTEWPLGSDVTLVYSYTLLANMKQLVVRVNRKDGQGVKPFDPDVRLLYKRSAASPPSTPK